MVRCQADRSAFAISAGSCPVPVQTRRSPWFALHEAAVAAVCREGDGSQGSRALGAAGRSRAYPHGRGLFVLPHDAAQSSGFPPDEIHNETAISHRSGDANLLYREMVFGCSVCNPEEPPTNTLSRLSSGRPWGCSLSTLNLAFLICVALHLPNP